MAQPQPLQEIQDNKLQNRAIIKASRRLRTGYVKPLPKPPTVPEPFNLTQPGKRIHCCIGTPDHGQETRKKQYLEKPSASSTLIGEEPSVSFKARSARVLSRRPFFPDYVSRQIRSGEGPRLATVERARRRHKLKREAQKRNKELQELTKKAIEEEIRKQRKATEFKATEYKLTRSKSCSYSKINN